MKNGYHTAGFSLLSVLIGLAIASATTLALGQLFVDHLRFFSNREAAIEQRQAGRAALAVLRRELALAGFPAVPDPRCHPLPGNVIMTAGGVRFLANLRAVSTRLAAPAAAGATALSIPTNGEIASRELTVSPGSSFARHDVIYLHDPGGPADPDDDRVECHRLDRAGRSGTIALASGDPVRRPFPAGAMVQVVNLIDYATNTERSQLIRTVDGGAQSVADGVAAAAFSHTEGYLAVRLMFKPPRTIGGPPASGAVWDALVAMRNADGRE